MALSFVIKETKNTSDHTYTIPFSVLDNSHIKLLITPGGGGSQVASSAFTLNTAGTVMTITAASYDIPLKIYRETPGTTDATKNTKFVDFVNGATLTETDLDNSTLQAIYASQESIDHVNTTVTSSIGSADMPSPASINYILASSPVDGSLGATWLSGANVDSLIGITEANTAAMIPRRNSAGTPAITTDLVGNVTGNATGSAGSLAPGGTIGGTGDVTYTSPTFSGANVTAASVVNKINGVTVTAAVAGDDGEVLTYNHGSTRWEPATANPPLALLADSSTGVATGKATNAASAWISVPIDTVVNNATLSSVTIEDATDGVIKLDDIGTYRISWQVPFYSCHSGYTKLMQSAAATVSSELLSSTPTLAGSATVAYANNTYHGGDLSHGFARLTIAADTYIQIQAYSQNVGTLGNSGVDPSVAYYFGTITIVKEL